MHLVSTPAIARRRACCKEDRRPAAVVRAPWPIVGRWHPLRASIFFIMAIRYSIWDGVYVLEVDMASPTEKTDRGGTEDPTVTGSTRLVVVPVDKAIVQRVKAPVDTSGLLYRGLIIESERLECNRCVRKPF